MLIPFYFLIGIWGGGPTACAATTKLVIYTLVGSLLMLAGAVATGVLAAPRAAADITFALSDLASSCRSRAARRSGSSCASRPPSW